MVLSSQFISKEFSPRNIRSLCLQTRCFSYHVTLPSSVAGKMTWQKPPNIFLMLYLQTPVLPVPFPGKSYSQPQLRGCQVTKLCVTLAPPSHRCTSDPRRNFCGLALKNMIGLLFQVLELKNQKQVSVTWDFFFFLMWTIFKIFVEFFNIDSVLFFGFQPRSMWDLSFSTKDWTYTPALKGEVLTTGLPGKSPSGDFEMGCH